LFVLRPVARQVTATLKEPLMLPAGSAVAGVIERPGEQGEAMETAMAEETLLSRPRSKTYQLQQGIFEHVSEHIRRDPAQSTRLLEAWIGSSGEKS
jgi:flagellar M-ring protein FliF